MNEHTANSEPIFATLLAPLSPPELTGRARTHVKEVEELGCALHPAAAEALLAMRAAAARDGIDPLPVSGFRDFERQLAIWNGKFCGERALLDANGLPLDVAALSEPERVTAILIWSALPGASRHHWGSDFDLIDRNAMAAGLPVELLGEDYASGGRYAKLSAWLALHMHAYGFFLPYDQDRGGVQPEPWHVSFAPLATPALAALSTETLRHALDGVALAGRDTVIARLPQWFDQYVVAVAAAPRAALAAVALNRAARLA